MFDARLNVVKAPHLTGAKWMPFGGELFVSPDLYDAILEVYQSTPLRVNRAEINALVEALEGDND